MSYIVGVPAYVTQGWPFPGVTNYGTIGYFMETSLPYYYGINPAIQGVWGPCANYSTVGDVVVSGGIYTNYGSIDHLLVRHGPVENRGFIEWIYLEHGPLVNFGNVNHLYIRDGQFDNFGLVHNLYKVNNHFSYVVDLAINQESSPFGPNTYVNQYFDDVSRYFDNVSSWDSPGALQRAREYAHEYEPVTSPESSFIDDDYDNDYQGQGNVSDTEIASTSSDEAENNPTNANSNNESDADDENDEADPVSTAVETLANEFSDHCTIQALASDGSTRGICCRICFEPVKNREPVSTHCGHIYCKKCLEKSWRRRRAPPKCPTCKKTLPENNLYHRIFI